MKVETDCPFLLLVSLPRARRGALAASGDIILTSTSHEGTKGDSSSVDVPYQRTAPP